MNILNQLLDLMIEKVDIKPIPQNELDDFLIKNNLYICKEYYQFLLNYGNSSFLKSDYADLRYEAFKDYYSDDKLLNDEQLPNECDYIGIDFSTNGLCIEHKTKQIYSFGYGKISGIHYGGLNELLFFYLLKLFLKKRYFDFIDENLKIIDINIFKQQYLDYEIKNIHIYNKYFFKDRQLIICDNEFHNYFICKGEILNRLNEQIIKTQ